MWPTIYPGSRQLSIRPATYIQEQKYAVYRTLPDLKSGTIFADCFKCHFSTLFTKEMVGLFDFFKGFLGYF